MSPILCCKRALTVAVEIELVYLVAEFDGEIGEAVEYRLPSDVVDIGLDAVQKIKECTATVVRRDVGGHALGRVGQEAAQLRHSYSELKVTT